MRSSSVAVITLGIYGIPAEEDDRPTEVHDHNLVVMEDGVVRDFIELERVTRVKHDNRLPAHLETLLDVCVPTGGDMRVAFVDCLAGRALATPNRRVELAAPVVHDLANAPLPAYGRLDGRPVETWFCNHELAHIGTHLPFTGGFAENSLLVHIDGGASRSSCSVWHFRDGKIRLVDRSWELHSQAMNFGDNPFYAGILGLGDSANLALAGKLMGYASYGRPDRDLVHWLREHRWFDRPDWRAAFSEAAERDYGWRASRLDPHDTFLRDLAACVQDDIEQVVQAFIYRYQDATGSRHLYYSGGVALNIAVNARLVESGRFETLHVPPCCNDSGLALGAAAMLEFSTGGTVAKHSPFLNSWSVAPYRYAPRFDVRDLASRIAEGQIVGVCVGLAEAGPRALGHRSILASPRSVAIRDRVSIEMKRREWYRPLAPIVLASEAQRLFECDPSIPLLRYMLTECRVRPDVREAVPGIVHANGTARVQIVDQNDPEQQLLTELLMHLRDRHSIPCLINTSFNRSGEPLVQTPAEALDAATELGLDAVVVDNELIGALPCTR